MPKLLNSSASASLGLLLARVPLGAYFLIAGFSKFTGKGGVGGFVGSATDLLPSYVPTPAGQMYLYALPLVEVLVGAMLVLGALTRLGGLLASLMLVSFLLAFGQLRHPELPFQPNVIFLGVALLVLLSGAGAVSFDRVIFGRPASAAPQG